MIALCSQSTVKSMVADTMFVHLYPDRSTEIGKLGFPEAKFMKGGNVSYKLLDFINIFNKHR